MTSRDTETEHSLTGLGVNNCMVGCMKMVILVRTDLATPCDTTRKQRGDTDMLETQALHAMRRSDRQGDSVGL